MMNHQNRRMMLRLAMAMGVTASAALFPNLAIAKAKAKSEGGVTADEALARLKAGNAKFAKGHAIKPDLSHQRVTQLAKGQKPIAVIITCSDSRVAPELVFDMGLGELFVLRDAGNTVDDVMEASVEYAVAELGAPLVVVMGHERCGAVKAAVEYSKTHVAPPGAIHFATDPILAAVPTEPVEDVVDTTVRENVRRVVRQLRSAEPILAKAVAEGRLKILGARYDLDDGIVDFGII